VGQGGQKVLHLWHHSQKIRTPQAKIFFRVQTRRLAVSFQTFTGSVAQTGPEKFPHKASCDSGIVSQKFSKAAGRQSVNLPKYHEWSIVTNYVDCLTICGWISLIDKPTRFRKNCMPSLLDHTYTNICDEQRINNAGITFWYLWSFTSYCKFSS